MVRPPPIRPGTPCPVDEMTSGQGVHSLVNETVGGKRLGAYRRIVLSMMQPSVKEMTWYNCREASKPWAYLNSSRFLGPSLVDGVPS
jgi:hypothetical protein